MPSPRKVAPLSLARCWTHGCLAKAYTSCSSTTTTCARSPPSRCGIWRENISTLKNALKESCAESGGRFEARSKYEPRNCLVGRTVWSVRDTTCELLWTGSKTLLRSHQRFENRTQSPACCANAAYRVVVAALIHDQALDRSLGGGPGKRAPDCTQLVLFAVHQRITARGEYPMLFRSRELPHPPLCDSHVGIHAADAIESGEQRKSNGIDRRTRP